ncbi:MAG: phosphatidylserine decarboxylase family protein [Candidatus Electryoneaceae bacterium]|nr:phosphatidylserine decarboxylase family protein [Candidatus Electryoneaceae bacterium]
MTSYPDKNCRKMRMAPEGVNIIAISGLLFLISVMMSWIIGKKGSRWLTVLAGGWLGAVLQFFRDPERIPPNDDDESGTIILSPADGKIIVIDHNPKDSPIDGPVCKVSIFMSPLNVHVNRSPIAGVVKTVEHYSGKFLSAFKPAASHENERTVIVLDTPFGDVAFKQVAGFLARRIVFHPKPGDFLEAGQRVGMIKFGSRVDLFMPNNIKLQINLGDRVTAGETIIGAITDVKEDETDE